VSPVLTVSTSAATFATGGWFGSTDDESRTQPESAKSAVDSSVQAMRPWLSTRATSRDTPGSGWVRGGCCRCYRAAARLAARASSAGLTAAE
jgi:hypothetical protein